MYTHSTLVKYTINKCMRINFKPQLIYFYIIIEGVVKLQKNYVLIRIHDSKELKAHTNLIIMFVLFSKQLFNKIFMRYNFYCCS